ncbi:MAG: hypothetical protein R3Y64_03760 [Peptostreptococcaceae bacterium]
MNPLKKNNLNNIKSQIRRNEEENENVASDFVKKFGNLNPKSIIEKREVKQEKVMLGIMVDKEISEKIKSFAFENDTTVSKIVGDVIVEMFKNMKINEQSLESYEKKYEKKIKRPKK